MPLYGPGCCRSGAPPPLAGHPPHLEDGCEEVTVPVLVLAPVLKVLKQRVQLVVRVALQVPAGQQQATQPASGYNLVCSSMQISSTPVRVTAWYGRNSRSQGRLPLLLGISSSQAFFCC